METELLKPDDFESRIQIPQITPTLYHLRNNGLRQNISVSAVAN